MRFRTENAVRLDPEVAAHIHLLDLHDLSVTMYGEIRSEVLPATPSAQVEWVGGGTQINWGGRLPAGRGTDRNTGQRLRGPARSRSGWTAGSNRRRRRRRPKVHRSLPVRLAEHL